jgi:hypothetical protein
MDGCVVDVLGWMEETGSTTPVTVETLRRLERAELIVDLVTGDVFEQGEDWWDFAQRWAAYRRQAGRGLDVEDLEAAISRASGKLMAYAVCREVAGRFFNRIIEGDGLV